MTEVPPGVTRTPPVHVRTIRIEATEHGGDELEVHGTLQDERPRGGGRWFGLEGDSAAIIHDMGVTLRVRYPDFVITGADASMTARPYVLCTDAVPPLQELVGLSIAQGFTRAVNERFGREKGCAHLTALIQAMAPVVKQAAGAVFRADEAPPKARDDMWFVGTCQAWREGGPLHQRLAAGDLEGLKALSARPPTP